jgi:hypothetical protein
MAVTEITDLSATPQPPVSIETSETAEDGVPPENGVTNRPATDPEEQERQITDNSAIRETMSVTPEDASQSGQEVSPIMVSVTDSAPHIFREHPNPVPDASPENAPIGQPMTAEASPPEDGPLAAWRRLMDDGEWSLEGFLQG